MNNNTYYSAVPPLTSMTRSLIILCVSVFFCDFVLTKLGFLIWGLSIDEIFGLVPVLIDRGWLWQFVTYIFIHAGPLHLFLNMLVLWYFGADLEYRFGKFRFLFYFLLCGVGAGLFNFGINKIFHNAHHLNHPIVGASGAIYGILVAYAIFYANRYFLVFFLFPMKAKYFVLIISAIELFMGVENTPEDNVAHFAHLGGMIVGALYIYSAYFIQLNNYHLKKWREKKNFQEREKLKQRFKLIVNTPPKKDTFSNDRFTETKKNGDDDDNTDGSNGPFWN